MERKYELFLQAVNAALWNRAVQWGEEVTAQELEQVLALSEEHHVLPMVFEAVHACPAMRQVDGALAAAYRHSTIHAVSAQAIKTEDFLALEHRLREKGLKPLVVKGIVCRNLYPKPDYRYSGDEDVLCGEQGFKACHMALVEFGMKPCSTGREGYEEPYRKEDTGLYIELHKTLFAENHPVFGDCNRFFEDVFQRSVTVTVQGQPVETMGHTDHMLYLIVHAFKHFLYSGFGIRQVCDMILFANAYGEEIDWSYVRKKCRSIRADRFAAALFQIGEKHLGLRPEKAYPRHGEQVDEGALLEDLLWGGIYGSSDRSRVHSSNMTLNAVADDKKGKRAKRSILRTVFPSAKSLEGRFPYLRKAPVLLPVAWACRILGYAKESISDPESGAAEVIRTGEKRIELLREYGIID